MAKKLDKEIGEVLSKYGFGPESCWDCHGTWVVYHKVLERIAAKSGIVYLEPKVLVSEPRAAVLLVTGELDGKSEWSTGEAVIDLNYKVSGKQAGYPFAMAEKRAKDRVILKLIGLHGLAYSEEEADEFRQANQPPPKEVKPPQTEQPYMLSKPVGSEESWTEYGRVLCTFMKNAATSEEVATWWDLNLPTIESNPSTSWQGKLEDFKNKQMEKKG
jgi:hypothetical protein